MRGFQELLSIRQVVIIPVGRPVLAMGTLLQDADSGSLLHISHVSKRINPPQVNVQTLLQTRGRVFFPTDFLLVLMTFLNAAFFDRLDWSSILVGGSPDV